MINEILEKLDNIFEARKSALGVGARPVELKYPKIAHFAKTMKDEKGEKMIKDIFSRNVEITSKMDGQQFGVYINDKHKPEFFSKSMKLEPGAFDPKDPDYKKPRESGFEYKDYYRAMKHFKDLEKQGVLKEIPAGTLISGEFFGSKQPNVLKYDREPKGNFVLFGVRSGDQWANYDQLIRYGKKLGVETVPVLFSGRIKDKTSFMRGLSATLKNNPDFMESVKNYFESIGKTKVDSPQDVEGLLKLFLEIPDPLLGGEKQEGVVIKDYEFQTARGLNRFLKYVRQEFAGDRDSAWSDVNKGREEIRLAQMQLRNGKITQEQFDQILKKNNYYDYLMKAEATDALFGIENRVVKAIAGLKEKRKTVDPNNVIAWLREDLKEEGYPQYIYDQYKKSEKIIPKHLQNKTQEYIYGDFWRNIVMLVQSKWDDITQPVEV